MSGRLAMIGEASTRGDATFAKARGLVLPTTRQRAIWTGSGLAAAGGTKVAADQRKKGNQRGAAVAGGAAGFAGTKLALDTTGYAAREAIQHRERTSPKHKRTKTNRKILSAHKRKYGVVEGPGKNPPNAYYRKMPKGVPLWGAKRAIGWKNYPPVVTGLMAAGTAVGASRAVEKSLRLYPRLSTGQIPAPPVPRVVRRGPKRKLTREQYDRAMQEYRWRNGLSSNVPVGIGKAQTTMSERDAARIKAKYGLKGPLPAGLSREQRMKAYEGRYIAAGGPKGEKWQRRVDRSEIGRNTGLAGATLAGAGFLASRGRRTGPALRSSKLSRWATPRRMENFGVASAVGGGASELYGEHARSRRASYRSSPAGVAGSALTRMQAYTPERRTS